MTLRNYHTSLSSPDRRQIVARSSKRQHGEKILSQLTPLPPLFVEARGAGGELPNRMSSLKLTLFGSPQVEFNGARVELETRKALALLAYLIITQQAHSRETLTSIF